MGLIKSNVGSFCRHPWSRTPHCGVVGMVSGWLPWSARDAAFIGHITLKSLLRVREKGLSFISLMIDALPFSAPIFSFGQLSLSFFGSEINVAPEICSKSRETLYRLDHSSTERRE